MLGMLAPGAVPGAEGMLAPGAAGLGIAEGGALGLLDGYGVGVMGDGGRITAGPGVLHPGGTVAALYGWA
jgi:hypothetical protein